MTWEALKTITVINTYHCACLTAIPDHVLSSHWLKCCSCHCSCLHLGLCRSLVYSMAICAWAARYNTWLLIDMTPKDVNPFFSSFLFFSFPFLSFPFLSFPFLSFPFLSPLLSSPLLSSPLLSSPLLSSPLPSPLLSSPLRQLVPYRWLLHLVMHPAFCATAEQRSCHHLVCIPVGPRAQLKGQLLPWCSVRQLSTRCI